MVIPITMRRSVEIMIASLLRDRECTLDLSSNYIMGLDHAVTSLENTIVKIVVLVMTLNKSKPNLNMMRDLLAKLA